MQAIKNNLDLYLDVRNKTVTLLMFIFAFYILLFSVSVKAQTPRTTPTPNRDTPVIVSRDNDNRTRTNSDEDVREIGNDENTVKLPGQITNSTNTTDDDTTKKQKKMMLYLDLLTRTEQRAASLQTQLFDLLEKQNSYSQKLNQLNYELRPEVISAKAGLVGSFKPEDVREQRKLSLELEKSNIETLLQRLDSRRLNLEESVRKAEVLVEKIRVKFDSLVDAALAADEEVF